MKRLGLVALMLFLILFEASAAKPGVVTQSRISGENRYETAIEISKRCFAKSEHALLANGNNYVDALAASTLANALKAPILLSAAGELPEATVAELNRLGTKQIILLGGKNTISPSVENALVSKGFKVKRIGGIDRYKTSELIFDEISKHIEIFDVMLATNEVDALASSPMRSAQTPLILVNKENPSKFIVDSKLEKIVIGGESQFSVALFEKLGAKERISGSNRYETASKLSDSLKRGKVILVNSTVLVDAFTSSVLAEHENAVILLSPTERIEGHTREYLEKYKVGEVILVGGHRTLSENVLDDPAHSKPVVTSGKIALRADGGYDINYDYFYSLGGHGTEWWFTAPPAYYQGLRSTVSETQSTLATKYHALWQAPLKDQKTVYLTFDEGYDYNNNTDKLLDIAKDKNVKFTFFLTNEFMDDRPDLVKRMTDEGHLCGNHSVRHLAGSQLALESFEGFINEYKPIDSKYETITGKKISHFMRPPMGDYSERSLALLHELGYVPVFWSFGYLDWDIHNQPSAWSALDQIKRQLHDGSILLLHAVSNTNVAIMPELIDYIIDQGYAIETLDKIDF